MGLIIGLIGTTAIITIRFFKVIARIKKVEKSTIQAETDLFPRFDKKLDKISDTLVGFRVSFAGLVSYLSA